MKTSLLKCLLISLLPVLAGCHTIAGTENDVSWRNVDDDDSWTVRPNRKSHDIRRETNEKVSRIQYRRDGEPGIDKPIRISCEIYVLDQLQASDGKGVVITDAKGHSYFVAIDDGHGNEHVIYNETHRSVLAAASEPSIRIGKRYKAGIIVNEGGIFFRTRGNGKTTKLEYRTEIEFPIHVFLQCQRSGAVFENVRVSDHAGDPAAITSRVTEIDRDKDGRTDVRIETVYRGTTKVMMIISHRNERGAMAVVSRAFLVDDELRMIESDEDGDGFVETVYFNALESDDIGVFKRLADGSPKPVSTEVLEVHKKMHALQADVGRVMRELIDGKTDADDAVDGVRKVREKGERLKQELQKLEADEKQ